MVTGTLVNAMPAPLIGAAQFEGISSGGMRESASPAQVATAAAHANAMHAHQCKSEGVNPTMHSAQVRTPEGLCPTVEHSADAKTGGRMPDGLARAQAQAQPAIQTSEQPHACTAEMQAEGQAGGQAARHPGRQAAKQALA